MRDDNRDLIRFQHIIDAISEIESFLKDQNEDDFQNDTLLQSACIRQLEIIGEASSRLSETTRKNILDIDWRELIGLRNILVHEYFGVDLTIIWQIINIDLPELKDKIILIIHELQK
ncbi:MAG TPA: DUF86 domain-containing protein [bacterium]|nr:DUF86 domain-containing protein [bacterium]